MSHEDWYSGRRNSKDADSFSFNAMTFGSLQNSTKIIEKNIANYLKLPIGNLLIQ